jgi:hypothetical protein
MGSITRSFANNITTSGVFKAGAFNNASLDNVTSVPALSMPAAGSMVLLSTQTASGDASISFTTGIDSTYKEYMFIFNNIHPATDDAIFEFNGSTDGGSTYNVTKTTTFFRAEHTEADTAAEINYKTADDLAQSTSYQHLFDGVGNGSDECLSGTFTLFSPSSTTFVKHFIIRTNGYRHSNASSDTYVAGYVNTTSAVDAVQFKFASGNIDDGTIQMFGIL